MFAGFAVSGWTQAQLAERLSERDDKPWTFSMVSDAETAGRADRSRQFTVNEVSVLARVFQVSVIALFVPDPAQLVRIGQGAVFNAAVNSDLIPRSPCRGIKLTKNVKEETRFLSGEEVDQLADAIDPRYRALVLTGAHAGLRPGELFSLKVNRLDMLRRQLKVVENLPR